MNELTPLQSYRVQYIEENTSFKVTNIIGNFVDITCTRCDFQKNIPFFSIKQSKNYQCEQCIDKTKIIYIRENTTFEIVFIKGEYVNISCTKCNHNKTVNFSDIKRSNKYQCEQCIKNDKINYVENNTTFKVDNVNGEIITMTCKHCMYTKKSSFSHIKRSDKYQCEQCVNKEKINYIESNTTFKVNHIESKYCNVTCTECNDNKTVQLSHIKRSNNYQCEQCVNIEKINYIKFSTNFMVNFIKGNTINMTCTKCNSIKQDMFTNVKKTNGFCEQCEHNKKLEVFKKSNMTYINKDKGNNYSLKCSNCNHEDVYNYCNGLRVKDVITCKKCARYLSGEEHKLNEFLISLGLIENKDYFINYTNENISELDFYFPEFNFAIEINGLAWHSTPNVLKVISSEDRHYKKFKYCKDNCIFLLQVTDLDIKNKFDIISSVITNKIELSKVISANECQIKEVLALEAINFLDNNDIQAHIQGNIYSEHNVGLYYQDELVSLLALDKSDIIRFCNKMNYNIQGALGRLIEYVVDVLKLHNISIISDNMYDDYSFYETHFELDSEIDISYKYTNSSFNKLEETNKRDTTDNSKYYDAGKTRWKHKKNTHTGN